MPERGYNKEQWWDYCMTRYPINEVLQRTNQLWSESTLLQEDRWTDYGHHSPREQTAGDWHQWQPESWERAHQGNVEANWRASNAPWNAADETTEPRDAITALADQRRLRD